MSKVYLLLELPDPHGVMVAFDDHIEHLARQSWIALAQMGVDFGTVTRIPARECAFMFPLEWHQPEDLSAPSIGPEFERVVVEAREYLQTFFGECAGDYILRLGYHPRVGWVIQEEACAFWLGPGYRHELFANWPADWRKP